MKITVTKGDVTVVYDEPMVVDKYSQLTNSEQSNKFMVDTITTICTQVSILANYEKTI